MRKALEINESDFMLALLYDVISSPTHPIGRGEDRGSGWRWSDSPSTRQPPAQLKASFWVKPLAATPRFRPGAAAPYMSAANRERIMALPEGYIEGEYSKVEAPPADGVVNYDKSDTS